MTSQTTLSRFGENGWTASQYRFFRALLGAYLLAHFASLLPWGVELFSSEGMLPSPELSPFSRAFPGAFLLADAPRWVTVGLALAVLASALLMLGVSDRVAALFLWWMLASLFVRNPLIANPSLPFVGWILLAHTLIPRAGPLRFGRSSRATRTEAPWALPRGVFGAAWIVMSVGYSYSGLMKLTSPSWIDGTALRHVLENPLARDTPLREWLLAAPDPLLALATGLVLAAEIGFAFLALSRRLRPFVWGAMLLMNLGLLATVRFADLTVGMLVLHAFTFDPTWTSGLARRFAEKARRRRPPIWRRAECVIETKAA